MKRAGDVTCNVLGAEGVRRKELGVLQTITLMRPFSSFGSQRASPSRGEDGKRCRDPRRMPT